MSTKNIAQWLPTGASLLTLGVAFFSGFAPRTTWPRSSAIDAVRVDVREIRALNNRIDNILLADRETPTQ